MDIEQEIARVRSEGEALAHAAEAAPFDAPVPGCPGWDVEALIRHVGDVHRWAGTVVRERVPERLQRDFEGPADREALLVWYLEGCVALVEALATASPDDTFWFWGSAPNALAFWARRQANETAIHRCDAESARGEITPLATVDAVDGLDEWVGLATRRAKAPEGDGRILRLAPIDANTSWSVILGDRVEVTSDRGRGHCELRGSASDLYLWSMNRRGTEGLTATGDESLLQVWTDNIRF
ncbi:MAG TPA: maleylpyruvate isomerase family mycothiol-dependent enzyme [Candidatus Dormibacteraeota bacterium]